MGSPAPPDRCVSLPYLLALDCSGESCSIALRCADGVRLHVSEPGVRQSERLLVWLAELLPSSTIHAAHPDGVAVGIGPGGFTGVRLAVAMAQGLALAWDRPVIPVSSLAALALAAGADETPVLATLDARMGEVYAGWFQVTGPAEVRALTTEQVLTPDQVMRPHGVQRYRVLGSGWRAHAAAIESAVGTPDRIIEPSWPCAEQVLALAERSWPHGALAPHQLEPAYLRNKVALSSAEQMAARNARLPASALRGNVTRG